MRSSQNDERGEEEEQRKQQEQEQEKKQQQQQQQQQQKEEAPTIYNIVDEAIEDEEMNHLQRSMSSHMTKKPQVNNANVNSEEPSHRFEVAVPEEINSVPVAQITKATRSTFQ